MRSLIIGLVWLSLVSPFTLVGHEGHNVPGALPPAPHGGVIAEAASVGGHPPAANKDQTELFFEAVYKDKKLSVFALTLEPKNTAAFRTLSVKSDLSAVTMRIENPRSKKTVAVKPTLGDSLELPYDAVGMHRFLIHLEFVHGKEKMKAKIQIEPNA